MQSAHERDVHAIAELLYLRQAGPRHGGHKHHAVHDVLLGELGLDGVVGDHGAARLHHAGLQLVLRPAWRTQPGSSARHLARGGAGADGTGLAKLAEIEQQPELEPCNSISKPSLMHTHSASGGGVCRRAREEGKGKRDRWLEAWRTQRR